MDQNQKPSWSFGATPSSQSTSSSPFTPTSTAHTQGSIFGANTATASTSGPTFGSLGSTTKGSQGTGIFGSGIAGSSTSPGGSGIFGGKPSGSSAASLFNSGGAQSSAGQGASMLGGQTSSDSSGGATSIFGAKQGKQDKKADTQTPSIFGGGAGTPNLLNQDGAGNAPVSTGFQFGQKPSTSNAPTKSTGGIFSTPNKTSEPSTTPQIQTTNAQLFGSLISINTGSSGIGSTTPATSKPFSFASTTPAGPPPTSNASSGGNFNFVNPAGNQPNSLFPTNNTSNAPTQQSSGAPAQPSIFGSIGAASTGGMFGATPLSTPASSNAPALSGGAPKANLFGSTTPAANPSQNIFGTPKTSQPSTSTLTSNTPQQPISNLGIFGGQTPSSSAPNQSAAPFTSNGGATTSGPGQTVKFPSFSTTSASQSTTTPTFALPGSSSIGSSTFAAASSATAPVTSASSGGFLNPGKLGGTSAPASTVSASPAPTSTATASGGLFGNMSSGKETAKSSAPTSNVTSSTSATAPNISAPATSASTTATPKAAVSTSGPAPTTQSKLSNKTMDEIITRWANDLSLHQKSFQKHAEKVAGWDRLLVENQEKISNLYGVTYQAERESTEISRQLSNVENQQEELSVFLDRYEREVEEMMGKQMVTGEGLQGPDQERERTYQMAERLSSRLQGMGTDLTTMIDEINIASSSLSKNNKTDDSLSQIVRVLNSHLSSLQWIDQNTSALHAKVTAAQASSQNMGSNGFGGLGSDAADEFMKSYMGRR
ncbi:MAG: FG-nucleoporin nsp1 [Vezdaea acicularis]|nr:MAG: FG-nucleoporin nsp1 [Vezdaea acicularis]